MALWAIGQNAQLMRPL